MMKKKFLWRLSSSVVLAGISLGMISCETDGASPDLPMPSRHSIPLLNMELWKDGHAAYKYDKKHRLISYVSYKSNVVEREISFQYDDQQQRIYAEMTDRMRIPNAALVYTDTLFLRNGLIDSVSGVIHGHTVYHFKMRYNHDRQLVKINVENRFMGNGNTLNEEHEYIWEQDDLKTFISSSKQETVERRNYFYTLSSAQPQFTIPAPNANLYPLQRVGYLGKLPKHLVHSENVSSIRSNQSTTYEYTIEKGLVKQYSVYLSPEVPVASVTYKWEE
ncbi:hypothetical protein HMPREF1870_02115 [Bacteroidales bacterium KA00344]|nr:hypothetical protein HMPREF1870_02115 [Bacteroidales bacterium KA00344]